MGKILDAVKQYLTDDQWRFTQVPDKPLLTLGVTGKNGHWECVAQAREDQEQFVFYSICPATAPAHKRQEMAMFLTMANYGLILGNFEMDYSDGEIRYKTAVGVEGYRLTPPIIKHMVFANVQTMDHYLPAIAAIVFANKSAAEAIAMVEGSGS